MSRLRWSGGWASGTGWGGGCVKHVLRMLSLVAFVTLEFLFRKEARKSEQDYPEMSRDEISEKQFYSHRI